MASVLLMDVSHAFWTFWFAGGNESEVSAAYEKTVGLFHKCAIGFDYVAACVDSPPYWRREIYPDYKGNRPEKTPVSLEQLARTIKRIEADGFPVLASPGQEADDILATAALKLGGKHEIVLGTSDKDCCQCVSDAGGVSVLSPLFGTEYTEAKVLEKFGCHPSQICDLLALVGDAGDNVPGVKGIGPVTAAKMLMTHGELSDVLSAARSGSLEPKRFAPVVVEAEPVIRLARRLVELKTDLPIDVDAIFKRREPVKLMPSVDVSGVDEPDAAFDEALPPVKPAEKTDGAAIEQWREPRGIQVAPQFDRGLEPTSLGGAYKLAVGMFESRLYSRFANPEAIWAVMIRGREMGLGALTALDMIHFFEGKPALHAHLIIARAKMHPECEYFQMVESSETRAKYRCKRRGNPEPTELTYTIEQARQAGLIRERGNWVTRPAEMLRKTCGVQLARIDFPEALLGAYSIEELNPEAAE